MLAVELSVNRNKTIAIASNIQQILSSSFSFYLNIMRFMFPLSNLTQKLAMQ